MQNNDILWTQSAVQDLNAIITYISENNPENAQRIFAGLRQECERLQDFATAGRIVPELKKQNILLYRELVIVPWRVIYRVTDNIIYILAVFDGRRNLYDVLLTRILNH